MQMRDDLTRKNNIPNKSNEFIQQEESFWPAICTLLCDKSMSISAANTRFWRVKWGKWSCMAALNMHKQLRVSEIQKMLVLGVFASTRRVDYLHAKYEEARCQEKFLINTSQTPCWRQAECGQSGAFLTHLLNIHPTRTESHFLTSQHVHKKVCTPWITTVVFFCLGWHYMPRAESPKAFSPGQRPEVDIHWGNCAP